MKFQGRDNCIFNLQDFYQDRFAECFFSCFRLEGEKTIFLTNEHYQEIVNTKKSSFQPDIKLFEDEIYQIIQTTDQSTINIYFEQLREYRNATYPYNQSYIEQEFQGWNNQDPELYNLATLQKYIEFLNQLHKCFLKMADKHLKIYDEGKYNKQYANSPQLGKTEDYKTKIWFKVGLLFANGEMDKLKTQFNSNATQIAKHLNNTSYRPFISESISKTNESDKNIYANPNKLLKICNHCIENSIPMTDCFKKLAQPK